MPKRSRGLIRFNQDQKSRKETRKAQVANIIKTQEIHNFEDVKQAMLERHGESLSHFPISTYLRELGAFKNPKTQIYEIRDWKLTNDELWMQFAATIQASVHDVFITPGSEVVLLTDHGVAERVAILVDAIRAEELPWERERSTEGIGATIPWRNAVLVLFRSKEKASAFNSKVLRILGGESIIRLLSGEEENRGY